MKYVALTANTAQVIVFNIDRSERYDMSYYVIILLYYNDEVSYILIRHLDVTLKYSE